jgi:hypothetical protein
MKDFCLTIGTITLVCIALCCTCGRAPVKTGQATEAIDVRFDPQQTVVDADTSVTIEVKDGEFTVSFVASYVLSGLVVCKQRFSGGWAAEIAPYDLTFCWGGVAEDSVRAHIKYWHSGRWYRYRYSAECPVSNQFIIEHTSNNHIIPANENILLAVASIKKDTPVMLWGYLVRINGKVKDHPYWWYTSLVRTDTAAHSCEGFYVTGVQIGYDIYE